MKAKIYCKKCNKEFNSILGFLDHYCPKEYIYPDWKGKVGQDRKPKNVPRDSWLDKLARKEKRKAKKEIENHRHQIKIAKLDNSKPTTSKKTKNNTNIPLKKK